MPGQLRCPPKKKRLGLDRKGKKRCTKSNKENHSEPRFQFLTEAEFDLMKEGYKPANTEKSTNWALRNFEAWKEARVEAELDPCPADLFSTDSGVLCQWLSRFAAETRTTAGKAYTPSTIYQLLTGLLLHMRDVNPDSANFLDKRDARFSMLHKSLDSLFRELRTKIIGAIVQHAQPFTKEEEQLLWERRVLGTSTPKSLLNAVFYLNGKNFCLRGGEEHRRLTISQIVRQQDPNCYIYTETGSKNRKGTFTEKHVPTKVVPIYESKEARERCHVRVLDVYLSKLPKQAFEKDIFYLRPLEAVPDEEGKPWFQNVPVGRNVLSKMVEQMCKVAGIEKRSNHSLRATAATEMFRANVPEKIIQERTGHRSLTALRIYEHTTEAEHQAVSEVLAAKENTTFHQVQNELADKEQLQVVQTQPPSQPKSFHQPQPPTLHQPQLPLPASSIFNMQGCSVTINMGPPPAPPSTAACDYGLSEGDILDFLKDL